MELQLHCLTSLFKVSVVCLPEMMVVLPNLQSKSLYLLLLDMCFETFKVNCQKQYFSILIFFFSGDNTYTITPWCSKFERPNVRDGMGRPNPVACATPCLWLIVMEAVAGGETTHMTCSLIRRLPDHTRCPNKVRLRH